MTAVSGVAMIKSVGLVDRLGGHDFHALDADPHGWFAHLAAVAGGDGGVADALEHVLAFDQFAKGGVFAVQALGLAQADKELAAGRIRLAGAGHG